MPPIMESILSKTPPWPGIKLLLSFIAKLLFAKLTRKSPNWAHKLKKTTVIISIVKLSVKPWKNIYQTSIHNKIPPKAPSKVLFGEVLGKILYWPIDLPIKYPPTSEAIIIDKRYKGCCKLIVPEILQIILIKRYKDNKIYNWADIRNNLRAEKNILNNKIIRQIIINITFCSIKKVDNKPNKGENKKNILFLEYSVDLLISKNNRKTVSPQKSKIVNLPILNAKKIKAIRTTDDISLIIKFDKILYFQNVILFNLK